MKKASALAGTGLAAIALTLGLTGTASASTAQTIAPRQPGFCAWHPANNGYNLGEFAGSYKIYDGQSTECNVLGTASTDNPVSIACYIDTTSGRWYYGSDLWYGITGWFPSWAVIGSTSTQC